MSQYQEYQSKIAELQVLAEEARQNEIAAARTQVLAIMREHGLTATDLFSSAKPSDKPRKAVDPKYRDPATGETWTGRGRSPKWLVGKDKDQFLIK